MNHTFSLIRNALTRSSQPVSGHAKRSRKGPHGKLLLAAVIASVTHGAMAAPQGGVVVDGNAHINYQDALTLINQHTDAITINWQNFDISAGETVTFLQPDANSYALNRVLTGDGTQINGQLNANGRVFVLDANGVLFGQSAQVNVGSLVASSLDISDADFANGHFTFAGQGNAGKVTNLGSITVADTGAVALLGGQVSNQGVIRARLGNVAMAAGNKVTLDFAGDGLLNVQIDESTAQALVNNGGLIQADGGSVWMTAHASDALLQTVVNNTGVIEARTLQERDGKIMLLGSFDGGTVQVAGKLDASATNGGDGGFIETSGAIVKISGHAEITAAAPQGKAGTWLLDPTDLEISYRADGADDNVSHAHSQTLQNSLNGGTNVTLETAASGNQAGNITLVDPLVWSGGATLQLTAHNNIRFNDYLHAPTGGLILSAGNNITTGAEGHINVGSFTLLDGSWSQVATNLPTFTARDFRLEGGSFVRALGGSGSNASPWRLTDIYGLQGLATQLSGHAVLANNIDASGTAQWNGGEGFNPIGTFDTMFTGSLNGAGFGIDGLTINRSGLDDVGLFGVTLGATLSNIGLDRVNISGGRQTGGLVGENRTSVISGSYVTGVVQGTDTAGGLVGRNNGDISHSYSTSAVSGGQTVGGLTGMNDVNGNVSHSYATGAVSGAATVGGLTGWNYGSINQSYATGLVNGSGVNQAGLVGVNFGAITESFWDSFTTGRATAIGTDTTGTQVVGEVNGDWNSSGVSAYQSANYAGFDFTAGGDWFIAEGSSRPMLRASLNFTQDGSGRNQITNVYQLQGMAADLAGTYVLANDIDASLISANGNTSNVWGGRGFAPVGNNSGGHFTGSLDGQGFVIDGLTINRADQDFVGLFGALGNASQVTNLGLERVSVSGADQIGALAGVAFGNIDKVYSSGTVTGGDYTGGLIGIQASGNTTASYSSATVQGDEFVGGLAGRFQGTLLSNSYATGAVTGNTSVGGLVGNIYLGRVENTFATGSVAGAQNTGGLVGLNSSPSTIAYSYASGNVTSTDAATRGGLVGNNAGTIANSFWDVFTSGQAVATGTGSNAGATALIGDWANLGINDSAYNSDSYTGFDFTNTWFIAEDASRPMLRALLSGNGEINNLYDLQGMAADLAGNYTLMTNLDASATAASIAAGNSGNYSDVWGGRGFAPVGGGSTVFSGNLDGQGFVINDLAINRDSLGLGLFGVLNGRVSNLGLVDVDITVASTALTPVGAIAGLALSDAEISQSFASGQINDAFIAGGLVGVNLEGTVEQSYSSVDINNAVIGGGLVGANEGLIQQSYATGNVIASASNPEQTGSGGLVGSNSGIIRQSYATGDVWGGDVAGGLVAGNSGVIEQSYATGAVGGNGLLGGLVGDNAPDGSIVSSFWNIETSGLTDGVGANNGSGTGTGLTSAQFTNLASFAGWDINADGSGNAVWRIYEGQTAPLLRAFLSDIEVTAYDDVVTYNGGAYSGRHQINGTSGNGVRYGNSYAEFVAAFGEDGTPYGSSDALGTSDLEYTGTSQGATNAGTYGLKADKLWSTQQGFNIVTPESALEVGAQNITITLSINDASKIYGDLDPAFTWRVTNGAIGSGDTLTGVLSRQAGENVGNYAITGQVTGDLASSNYNVTINNGVFTITPRPISISIADLEKVYGNLDPELAWRITSGSIAPRDAGEIANLISLSREAGENAGTYAINGIVGGVLASGNYRVSLDNGQLVITPRAIEISADVLSKIYGQADPALGWEITGGSIVDGDTLVVALSRDEGRDVGTYAIRVNVEGDVVSSGNYQVTTVDGSLEINPAALTVTANDIRTYWNLLPPYTARVDGLVEGDTIADVFGNSLTVTSDLDLPIPGDYRLTPTAQLASNNYTVSFNDGTLSLLSSNPGDNYGSALTASQLPAREALGRENRANIFEARPLLDGSESGITLQVLDGGVRIDPDRLAALGLIFPQPVRFPVNSSVIAESYLADLRRFAAQLQRYPGVQVLVEGHTSSTGSLALNDRLSRARADAVATALQGMGVAEDRIRQEAFNYQHPVATNDTLEGRLLNQRTEISEDKQ
ncbi:MBG domain-containing protein [Cellvibrio polysaccharolyticus]|nr:MBG domain-containing protein [Cellvibrio polysaccharolyticus]